jgi:hypothetical protein
MPRHTDYSQLQLKPITARGTGTVYTLTAAAAAVAFGTLSPAIVLPEKGVWWVEGYAILRYEGATFAAARTVTLKLRRTNNTAADLDNGSRTLLTGVTTTVTDVCGTLIIPPTEYITSNGDDAITLFADVSVLPSAGTFTIVEAYIAAYKFPSQ